jgi:hypothetical protein
MFKIISCRLSAYNGLQCVSIRLLEKAAEKQLLVGTVAIHSKQPIIELLLSRVEGSHDISLLQMF